MLFRSNILELGVFDASKSLGWLSDVATLCDSSSITNTVDLWDGGFGAAKAVVTDIGVDFEMTNALQE